MAVRWGILGCAGNAEKFCASVSRVDAAEVAAVASRSLEKAEQFITDNCPGAKAYGSYQDLQIFQQKIWKISMFPKIYGG